MSGLIYAGLAFTAVQLIVGSGGNNSSWMQAWTARLFATAFGQWLGIVGVYVLGVGLSYLYTACIAKFGERIDRDE